MILSAQVALAFISLGSCLDFWAGTLAATSLFREHAKDLVALQGAFRVGEVLDAVAFICVTYFVSKYELRLPNRRRAMEKTVQKLTTKLDTRLNRRHKDALPA